MWEKRKMQTKPVYLQSYLKLWNIKSQQNGDNIVKLERKQQMSLKWRKKQNGGKWLV